MILGVSFDTPAENKAFAEKQGFHYPLLCDTARDFALAYGAIPDKSSANANRVGIVIDPEGKIREWHAAVGAKTFPQELLARL